MDLNDLRSAVTVTGLLLFLLLLVSVWQPRRRAEFAEAARLPFEGESPAEGERHE